MATLFGACTQCIAHYHKCGWTGKDVILYQERCQECVRKQEHVPRMRMSHVISMTEAPPRPLRPQRPPQEQAPQRPPLEQAQPTTSAGTLLKLQTLLDRKKNDRVAVASISTVASESTKMSDDAQHCFDSLDSMRMATVAESQRRAAESEQKTAKLAAVLSKKKADREERNSAK